jgi:tetratricopeptide (TPR) repeat protein
MFSSRQILGGGFMSLINQMLRDLEKRHTREPEPGRTQRDLCAETYSDQPQRHSRGKYRALVGIGVLLVLGSGMGAGWHLARHNLPQQASAPHTADMGSISARIPAPERPVPDRKSAAKTEHISEKEPGSGRGIVPSKEITTPEQEEKRKRRIPEPETLSAAPETKTPPDSGTPPSLKPSTAEPAGGSIAIKPALNPVEQRRQVLKRAQQHYADAHYSKTIEALQQHLQRAETPDNPTSEADEIRHLDAQIYRYLALAQLRLQQDAQALRTLERGHTVAPDDIEVNTLYARILLEENESARAYTILRRMTQPHLKEHPDFYALRALLARHQGAYAESEALYTLLCEFRPRRGDWRLGLALSQHLQGKAAQAYHNYQQAASNTALEAELRDFAARQAEQIQINNSGSL